MRTEAFVGRGSLQGKGAVGRVVNRTLAISDSCGRRWGWDDLREQHWNMYITICETDHQSRFDAWDRVLRAGALGWPWGMGWGERWEGDSGWGTHVHPWLIHVNVWQKAPQHCKEIILRLKHINLKKKKEVESATLSLKSRQACYCFNQYSAVKQWYIICYASP